jgi:hypothetical protein
VLAVASAKITRGKYGLETWLFRLDIERRPIARAAVSSSARA